MGCLDCGTAVTGRNKRCEVCKKARSKVAHRAAYLVSLADGTRAEYMQKTKERRDAHNKKWYCENRDKALAWAKNWREQNRESHLANLKLWREANKDHVKAYQAQYGPMYKAKNKARLSELGKKYRALRGDEYRAYKIAHYRANKEHIRAKNRLWLSRNPDAITRAAHKRRARMEGVGGTLSRGITKKLYKRQKGLCACCGQPLIKFHLDHIMPIALGGTNTDDNVQLLLPRCNLQKGSRLPNEYKRLKEAGLWR